MHTEDERWIVQGRELCREDLQWISQYVTDHPEARRKRIAMVLCEHWGWKNGRGHWKEMAARELLNKLADRGLVQLPPLRKWVRRNEAKGRGAVDRPAEGRRIEGMFCEFAPFDLKLVEQGSQAWDRWAGYLRHYHYLGLRVVGENMGYLVQCRTGEDVAAALFGAPAWRCAARDQHLGWSDARRAEGLAQIANNTRFLILPWVRVPHLASHILGQIGRRINHDWQEKYGHGLDWLETFVDIERYRGICYLAANWIKVGHTQGRSRQDRKHRLRVGVKAVYLYRLKRTGHLA